MKSSWSALLITLLAIVISSVDGKVEASSSTAMRNGRYVSLQQAGTLTPASIEPVATKIPQATRTPEPTPTPLATPPASDPDTTKMMIFFGILLGLVIIFGIVINTRKALSIRHFLPR